MVFVKHLRSTHSDSDAGVGCGKVDAQFRVKHLKAWRVFTLMTHQECVGKAKSVCACVVLVVSAGWWIIKTPLCLHDLHSGGQRSTKTSWFSGGAESQNSSDPHAAAPVWPYHHIADEWMKEG